MLSVFWHVLLDECFWKHDSAYKNVIFLLSDRFHSNPSCHLFTCWTPLLRMLGESTSILLHKSWKRHLLVYLKRYLLRVSFFLGYLYHKISPIFNLDQSGLL